MNGFVYCSVNKNISEYVQHYEYIHPVLGSDGTQVLLVVCINIKSNIIFCAKCQNLKKRIKDKEKIHLL